MDAARLRTSDMCILPFWCFQTPEYFDVEFRCLEYALFVSCFIQALGGFFFLWTSFYVLEDKSAADRAIAGDNFDSNGTVTTPIIRDSVEDSDDTEVS